MLLQFAMFCCDYCHLVCAAVYSGKYRHFKEVTACLVIFTSWICRRKVSLNVDTFQTNGVRFQKTPSFIGIVVRNLASKYFISYRYVRHLLCFLISGMFNAEDRQSSFLLMPHNRTVARLNHVAWGESPGQEICAEGTSDYSMKQRPGATNWRKKNQAEDALFCTSELLCRPALRHTTLEVRARLLTSAQKWRWTLVTRSLTEL